MSRNREMMRLLPCVDPLFIILLATGAAAVVSAVAPSFPHEVMTGHSNGSRPDAATRAVLGQSSSTVEKAGILPAAQLGALNGLLDAVGSFKEMRASGQHLRGKDSVRSGGTAAAETKAETAESYGKGPKVFFLFLTYSGMARTDLWQAFFEGAPKARWAAFLHCKDQGLCQKQLHEANPLDVRIVDTVDSEYCEDLVSPMVQLLKAATKDSTSDGDKFVFLSESTLPVKPFAHVAQDLAIDQNSDFCIRPEKTWMTVNKQLPSWFVDTLRKDAAPGSKMLAPKLVKSSQWVVLSKDHANLVVKRWHTVKGTDSPVRHHSADDWYVPVWAGETGVFRQNGDINFMRVPGQQQVCADEWVIFAAVYGVMTVHGRASLPGLSSQELKLVGSSAHQQGVCRTFDTWGSELDEYPDAAHVVSELSHDAGNSMSCPQDCDGMHPAEFDSISTQGLTALRRSPYLFARKFGENVVTLEQFRKVILAS